MTAQLAVIIAAALIFDFINGFHDAANSIATVVSTRVLSPRAAVVWAAAFNFIAFLVFPTYVSASIAKGVAPGAITGEVIFATLLGAIAWNLLTWWWGLPSSSSHALMGAFAGAALTHAPRLSTLDQRVFGMTFLFIVLAPLIGLLLGYGLMMAVRALCGEWRPATVDRRFRRGQLLPAALYSLGHGGNDAQKTMALSGGWRIVKTMGMKITKLRPVGGFCAETSGAITLAMATLLGVPVSTTHTITGAIVGVGATEGRMSAVRWGVAGRIVWAWVLTIPAAAALAALAYLGLHGLGVLSP